MPLTCGGGSPEAGGGARLKRSGRCARLLLLRMRIRWGERGEGGRRQIWRVTCADVSSYSRCDATTSTARAEIDAASWTNRRPSDAILSPRRVAIAVVETILSCGRRRISRGLSFFTNLVAAAGRRMTNRRRRMAVVRWGGVMVLGSVWCACRVVRRSSSPLAAVHGREKIGACSAEQMLGGTTHRFSVHWSIYLSLSL